MTDTAQQQRSLPLPLSGRWTTWTLVAAGTLVRLIHGHGNKLWNSAPDQLAWGMGLDDLLATGTFNYEQLIHYPHEGGSLLLGLLSFLFVPLGAFMPPLSWAALAVDTFARTLQIGAARRLVGERTALWFGAWTVFAAPLMLPWGTVNFGLHAAMSFAPFALVLLATHPARSAFRTGLWCGLLASLAYDVWVFAPAFLLLQGSTTDPLRLRIQAAGSFLVGCAITFTPHLLVRVFADQGFGLEDPGPLSIRGLEREAVDAVGIPGKLWQVCTAALPASFTLGPVSDPRVRLLSLGLLGMLIAGGLGLWRQWSGVRPAMRLLAFTGLSFILVVAIAPFFRPHSEGSGYLYYRYFPFIAPLLVLLVMHGWNAFRTVGTVFRASWLLVCMAASLVYMARTTPSTHPNDEATGWVLARKYGDRPERLMRIIQGASSERRAALVYGAGWGLTAALFDRRTPGDTAALAEFDRLWERFPAADQPVLAHGVHRAFDPGITPVLDPALAPLVLGRVGQ